jgi:hypothetical protein
LTDDVVLTGSEHRPDREGGLSPGPEKLRDRDH